MPMDHSKQHERGGRHKRIFNARGKARGGRERQKKSKGRKGYEAGKRTERYFHIVCLRTRRRENIHTQSISRYRKEKSPHKDRCTVTLIPPAWATPSVVVPLGRWAMISPFLLLPARAVTIAPVVFGPSRPTRRKRILTKPARRRRGRPCVVVRAVWYGVGGSPVRLVS
jgi:hypothetical protein